MMVREVYLVAIGEWMLFQMSGGCVDEQIKFDYKLKLFFHCEAEV